MQLYEAVKKLVPPREDGVWVNRARELTAVAMKPFTDARTDNTTRPMHIGRPDLGDSELAGDQRQGLAHHLRRR